MKKKIQKPFDVAAAKGGAKVETRDGDSVRILCYDRKSNNLNINFPIIALTIIMVWKVAFLILLKVGC